MSVLGGDSGALRGMRFFGTGMCCLVGVGGGETGGCAGAFVCFVGALVLINFFGVRCFVGTGVLALAKTGVFFAFGFTFFGAKAVLTLFLTLGIGDFFFDIRGYKIPLA